MKANFGLVISILLALLIGERIAAVLAGRAFSYSPTERDTIWVLTLPQVAATLAATLVAYETFDGTGERLLDSRMLDAVIVLMMTTAILGPILTERFAARMITESCSSTLGISEMKS